MNNTTKAIVLFIVCLFIATHSVASAQEIEALKGVKSAKAIFDFRIDNLKSAALHLKLIHQTFVDLSTAKKNPDFKVVFIGPSVKLISKNRAGFAAEDNKTLDEIAEAVSALSKDGAGIEVCLIAASLFKVDPASVLPEIKGVENGWFSLIGYQTQGYALVPNY